MTDLEIAQKYSPKPIKEIAAKLGIDENHYLPYGHDKAKLDYQRIIKELPAKKNSKLILVSAINPTPAGEGKTTVSVGLNDGLMKLGNNSLAVLREPSLGPVFGMKGGATGGGNAQLIPMEDINLHFTGDLSAVEKAHNLLSALIDNQVNHHTDLNLNPKSVVWKRVMDLNDRALRSITIGQGAGNGMPRETGFDITAASELMAILCLATDIQDLKNRIGKIFVGFTYDKKPVYAKDIKAEGAMASLLKDAIKPNLVQSLEGNPALLHGGPFANIAQGTNTAIATKLGLHMADYVVTEAGFGFDLGGEKFLDIKSRAAGLNPELIVLVATVRALKYHGGKELNELVNEDLVALKIGFANLKKHIDNASKFGIVPVVAINRFKDDTEAEVNLLKELCAEVGINAADTQVWAKGGEGAIELAELCVATLAKNESNFKPLYDLNQGVKEKIEIIAKEIYGAQSVEYSAKAQVDLRRIEKLGLEDLAICMAKTQYSFSDDAKKRNIVENFNLQIREIEIAAGAGFLVPIAGSIMRMPGLPLHPASENIDIDESGKISGLF